MLDNVRAIMLKQAGFSINGILHFPQSGRLCIKREIMCFQMQYLLVIL